MTWHVVGIDASLQNTGVARIRGGADGQPESMVRNVLSSPVKTTRSTQTGELYAGLLDRRNRFQTIAARVVRAALDGYDPEVDDVPLFVIESPLYAAKQNSASVHDRAWTWGLIVHTLFKHGFVVEVSTTTMKSYASGKGSGRKAGVLAAMPYMFPGLFVDDDNAADALALAAMGARYLGFPVEPSPQRVNPSALNGVNGWPTHDLRRNPS